MQTIKTAIVVVMLLAVLYGAYVALNGSDTPLPPELDQVMGLNVEFGGPAPLADNASGSGFFAPNASGSAPSNHAAFPPAFSSNDKPSSPFPPASSLPPFPNSKPDATLPPPPSPFPSNNVVDTGKPFEPLAPAPLAMNSPNASPSLLPQTNLPSNNTPTSPSLAAPSLSMPNASSNTASNGLSAPLTPPLNSASSDSTSAPSLTPPAGTNLVAAPSLLGSSTPGSTASSSDDTPKEKWEGLPNGNTTKSFQNAKTMAMDQASKGELKEALATLSLFYNAPELTIDQHQELLELLDPLAGEVIYSRRHLLDIPYVVGQGETLEHIAKQYEIPVELLAKINALDLNGTIPASTKIKVVPGPFRAEIDLTRSELTLFLGELYAGRFAIEVGKDPIPKEGIYQVLEKQKNRNFYGKGGTQIAGNDPRNPYGGLWIDLGQDICIHGTPEQALPGQAEMGCISLSPIDASDVFGMLSRGSQVQIRR